MSLRFDQSVRLPAPLSRLVRLAARAVPRRLDWVLLAAVLTLGVLGALMVWSATLQPGGPPGPTRYAWRHLGHLLLALPLCLAVAAVDHRRVRAYAPVLLVAVTVALLLVLGPLGEVVNGSRAWIAVGGLQVQPAETAKIALILTVAAVLGGPPDRTRAPAAREVLLSLGVLAVPTGLVLLQPDLGSALVLGAIHLAMLALSGASPRWPLALLGCGALGALAVWWLGLLKDYQVARLVSFLDPGADPLGAGYNVNQALIAVGSGGLGGAGLFQGWQTSGKLVPEQHTDFVFSVVAEELGFAGGCAVIVLLGVVLLRVLRTAARCDQPYGRLVCVGVAAWFCFQVFVNIGMTLGLSPVTGLPLPFVSYGGSAAVANLTAVGLVLGVHAHTGEPR
ncbi:MAG TPA: rod shape-determining protein RodA [Thermobifida alba]|nr:rod shape-determining protein RodA [Thermobifida alba]